MLKKMFKMKGNKGFTLVELMVVVVIIGVLTAIAVPVYNNASNQAKINAIAANLRIINGVITQYQADKGTAPTADFKTELGPYLQAWPDNNPKGVDYAVGNQVATGVVNFAGTGPIQAYANVPAYLLSSTDTALPAPIVDSLGSKPVLVTTRTSPVLALMRN